jgi:GNAT superfamily N-acetyltransferase
MPAIAIRVWSESDSAESLTALLHRAYAPLGARGWNYTAVDQSVKDTKYRIGLGTCAVALDGGVIVGTVTVRGGPVGRSKCAWYRKAGVAIANQLAVEPAWQGRGLGSQLMAWAEAWAAANGYAEIAIDTAESAAHLVDYYARRGFRRVDDVQWPGKRYRSVVLSRSLSP